MPCRSSGHLLARSEDARDIHLPLLLWWALEAKVATDPEAVLALFQDRAIWDLPIVRTTVAERLMRRFAAAGTRQDLTHCARLLALAPGPDHIKRLMAGFEAAYRGPVAGRAAAGAGRCPGASTAGSRSRSACGKASPRRCPKPCTCWPTIGPTAAKQLQLLQILGEVRRPACVPVVLRLACQSPDNALRTAALTALAGYDDPAIAVEVLKAYANMSDDVLAAAQSLLATRRAWAARFLEAIEAQTIDPHTVPREVVEKLLLLGDSRINALATRLFGPIKPATSAELHAQIDRLAAVIRAGSGRPQAGQADLRPAVSPAAIPCSAKGARLGPTSPPTAATIWRRCS